MEQRDYCLHDEDDEGFRVSPCVRWRPVGYLPVFCPVAIYDLEDDLAVLTEPRQRTVEEIERNNESILRAQEDIVDFSRATCSSVSVGFNGKKA